MLTCGSGTACSPRSGYAANYCLCKHPGKTIYLACDNARYNRCAWLQEWAKSNRIEFVILPAYSSNLNLIERLRRLLRQEEINSRYYANHDTFRAGMLGFLDKVKKADGYSILADAEFSTD